MSRSDEKPTKHDICYSVSREVREEEIYPVVSAGVQEEDSADEVLVSSGVCSSVSTDCLYWHRVFPDENIYNEMKYFHALMPDLMLTTVGPHKLRAPHRSVS